MSNIADLKVLEKYLSEDELKGVAKEAAFQAFSNSIGKDNPHNKSNLEYYLKQGALDAVRDHLPDLDAEELTSEMKKKTLRQIRGLKDYQLPDDYRDIAREVIEQRRSEIESKVNTLIDNFLSDQEPFGTVYTQVGERVSEAFSDIMYGIIEKQFKSNE